MRKSSVYISTEEYERLRRASLRSGRSQAELIREGIRTVIAEVDGAGRVFQSMGAGHGDGRPYERWRADDVLAKRLGRGS